MELIKINSNNRPYYSDDFIKGFECGVKRQFEADKKASPKGEWISEGRIYPPTNGYHGAVCSICGTESEYLTNFCGECGADMRKDEPQTDIHGLTDCDFCKEKNCEDCEGGKDEPQTDTEIAKAIVHKMIDDAVIAEDAYPDLRQKMHDAVDEYEPQTEREGE